jgi:hypothetical protein
VVRAVARGFSLGRRGYLALSFETALSRIVAAVRSHRGAVNQHAIYAEIYCFKAECTPHTIFLNHKIRQADSPGQDVTNIQEAGRAGITGAGFVTRSSVPQ